MKKKLHANITIEIFGCLLHQLWMKESLLYFYQGILGHSVLYKNQELMAQKIQISNFLVDKYKKLLYLKKHKKFLKRSSFSNILQIRFSYKKV